MAERKASVAVSDQGTVVGFTPMTEAAKEWFAENVQSEGYQWLGSTLWVDHRMADHLAEGLEAEGLL